MKEFIKSIRKIDIVILIISFIILLFLDQYTKYLTEKNLELNETHKFIDGFMNFTYIRNRGASFGMLQGKQTLFIIFIADFSGIPHC